MGHRLLNLIGLFLACFGVLPVGYCQTFTGTNEPGAVANFSFAIAAGTTNWTLSVPGQTNAYSYLFLKKGAVASETNYTYSSRLSGGTNSISLELPEGSPATWHVSVLTPVESEAHTFAMDLKKNVAGLRAEQPVDKPLSFSVKGGLAAGKWHYYRVEIPNTLARYRISLAATNRSPDLYIQKDTLPTTTEYLRRSTNALNDILNFADTELVPGSYFIGVYSPSGKLSSYELKAEAVQLVQLAFDAGETKDGTEVYSHSLTNAGDTYFRVRTEMPPVGVWRIALKVIAGEADLYVQQGVLPSTTVASFKSLRVGSDGIVFGSGQFAAGQDWYIMVRAKANSRWTLVSGAAYVKDLGPLSEADSSGMTATIGPEGWLFYKTDISDGSLAWRLSLGSSTNEILVKKTSLPLFSPGNKYELKSPKQMLVVPPYLVAGDQYLVGIPGNPGTTIALDSRVQAIRNIAFVSSDSVSANGYTTYRVEVPPDMVAWQLDLVSASPTTKLYARRTLVPNEWNNETFTELVRTNKSLSLTPPLLADGTWYVTVVGDGSHSFKLKSGPAQITDIELTSRTENNEPHRVGWRYFRVTDIAAQLGALGWELSLTNFAPGTRIAVGRNQAPSVWQFRPYNNSTVVGARSYTYISQGTSLKLPGHQADVWYVGVYNPGVPLRNFKLISEEIKAQSLAGDGGKHSRSLRAGTWAYYQVDVPPDIMGWDVRLTNTTGLPKMLIARQALPVTDIIEGLVMTNLMRTTLLAPGKETNWPVAKQWLAGFDWTRRPMNSTGQSVSGRILAMGMGRPLQPGTHYVGVFNPGTTNINVTIMSRFIGNGRIIPVKNLSFDGGSTNGTLVAREAAYYRVNIPPLTRSWKVKLSVSGLGEAMLVASTNRIPNVESEKRMQKVGREHYVLLPEREQQYLRSGDYYLVVVGEGVSPLIGRVGGGVVSYTLQSLGAMPEPNLGKITAAGISKPDKLEGGEVKVYHLTIPTNIAGYEIVVTNKIGNPVGVIRHGELLPDPGLGKVLPADPYGNEGGQNDTSQHEVFNSHLYAAAFGLAEGIDTFTMKARAVSGAHPDASYTLQIKELIPKTVPFDKGVERITNQIANTWKFFKINVPANALGWDLRLTNVTKGTPKLIVARQVLPIPYKHDTFTPTFCPPWPITDRWMAMGDWTERAYSVQGVSEDNRLLAMGMGRPLVPDTYYVGIFSSMVSSYALASRGIGDGFSIPVRNLPFSGTFETVTTNTLPAREAAYFRVEVPPNMQSWKLSLDPKPGCEANLLVLKDALPNVLASAQSETVRGDSAGRQTRKAGAEDFLLLPADRQLTLTSGVHYVAVISEGMNPADTRVGTNKVGYTLTSHGELALTNFGVITSAVTNQNAMNGGEVVGYRFELPPGTVSLEARLENQVGNPVMVLRQGPSLPDPATSFTGIPADPYGVDGGESAGNKVSGSVITYANPTNGVYYLLIKARPVNGIHLNASFTLRLSVISSTLLDFDGGKKSVTNQISGSWSYFRVDVPEGAAGWDLRLTNVVGLPKIVVNKDALPGSFATRPWSNPGNQATWPSSNSWAAASDWTRRQFSADGAVDENGRVLAMGMGRPLTSGSYYVGVVNTATSSSMSYTIMSRGIGDGLTIPVIPLPFEGGTVTNLALGAREAAYFKVEIPPNAPSFKVKLTGLSGETMMVGLRGFVPNVEYHDPVRSIQLGRTIQKLGNEHFLLLPPPNQSSLGTGMVYFAVAGEGPVTNSARIGRGTSSFVLNTLGVLPLTDFGLLGTNEIEYSDTLEGGESKGYEFVLDPEILGVEAKLENRVGNPVMVWREGELFPNPGAPVAPLLEEFYGNEGGSSAVAASQTLLTLATTTAQSSNGFSTNRLMIKARATSGVFSDASYKLRLRPITVPNLNFTPALNGNGLTNSVTATLENGQRAFYRVVVPPGYIGWKLELVHASGVASVRARKDQFPSDNPLAGTGAATPATYIVPPVLTPGTWFVEVKAQSLTTYTLTSSALEVERSPWTMPAIGETNTAPGMSLPFFGDTAVDTNGVLAAIPSTFLEAGYQHYYALHIPTQNVGVLRVQLEAISGNPNLYLRHGDAPTINHSSAGNAGTIFDRTVGVSLGTEYANFVPVDGKLESSLKSGLWYLAVRANGGNCRYRIRLSTGNIQQIPVDGTALTNQVVAGGDWKYYQFRMPDPVPAKWQLTFAKQLGDMAVSIRDTIPPGTGVHISDRRHWGTDSKNHGPYLEFSTPATYTFNTPPSRPGALYYVGVRGLSDATYSLNVKTLEADTETLPELSFYSGSTTVQLPGFSQQIFRINVPMEGTRLKLTNTHSTSLRLHIEQGTLPLKTTQDDWRSSTANSILNQYLGGWPWVPGQAYFLLVTNISSTPQTLTILRDGKNATTDDDDRDGILDAWEREYFGSTSPNPSSDFDSDGVSNRDEYLEGTNPADNTLFNPRLSVTAVNGSVLKSPNQVFYAKNATVQLTPVPDFGYAFGGWTGGHVGSQNPLNLLMDTNKTLTAIFKVPGDDFAMRIPLTGTSVTTNASNVNATKEPAEVDHGGNVGGRSLWWSWTAPSSGVLSISTEGSSFPTLLGVYIGNALTNLYLETNDTNLEGGSYRAQATLPVESGRIYQIAVDGLNGTSGNVQLALTLAGGRPTLASKPTAAEPRSSEIDVKLLLENPTTEKMLRFSIVGTNRVHLIEGSTNLTDWTVIGTIENGVAEPLRQSTKPGASMFYRLRAK